MFKHFKRVSTTHQQWDLIKSEINMSQIPVLPCVSFSEDVHPLLSGLRFAAHCPGQKPHRNGFT